MTSSPLTSSSPPSLPTSTSPPLTSLLCYAILIINQLMFTGLYILAKAAFNHGMNTMVFIFYRQATGAILLLLFALHFTRETFMKLSLVELLKIISLALIGITLKIEFSYASLKYTSPTLASALTNAVPVLTFCLALLFRTEKLKLKSSSGIAKAIGIAVSIAGIFVIALYGGPMLNPLSHHQILGKSTSTTNTSHTWLKGSLLMTASCICWSLWLVLQVEVYTWEAFLLSCTLQSLCIALVVERDYNKWKLGLAAVIYSGVVQGLTLYLQTWCIAKKGVVFYSLSCPLELMFTIMAEIFFLGDGVHLGSVLGGVLMVGGLYSVLWGKGKESNKVESSNGDGKEQVAKEPAASSPFHPV